ncbi:MAG: hypothetical protein MJA27_03810, partial [Pseudanabaenales cyanobacterium]|nr:hypothetical protein [Pseudanabaenales cyanobacterium]
YFLDQANDIQAYLPFEASDAFPRINLPDSLSYRGAEVTVFTINIASVVIIFTVIFSFISWVAAVIAAFLTTIIAWVAQKIYFRKKLKRSEALAKYRIFFSDTPD